MLKAIVQTKNISFWILIHAIVGMAASFSPVIFAIWLFAFGLSSLSYLNKGTEDGKKVNLLYLISYVSALDLLNRMAKGYQYKIPWELGKYVLAFGFLYGVVALNSRKGLLGFVMIFLLIPSLFFGPESNTQTSQLVGNIAGPMAIGFAVFYCTKLKITRHQIITILKLILLPCVSVLAFTVIKNPDFSEYEFKLGAEFATAGGFGSNQVATILGLGLFLVFVFWINKWELFKNNQLTLLLLAAFGIQGLLTFSRGGMIGAVVGIITISIVYSISSAKAKTIFKVPKISGFLLAAIISITSLFYIANEITGGVLELRYSGETNATLRGTQEKSLDVLTTNRFGIFMADLDVWQDYFVFGAGVGGSQILRSEEMGMEVAAHVELSRLLSEHGLLGLTYFIILLVIGFRVFNNRGNPKYTALLFSLFILAVYTTFHAATRTFLTPLLIGLSTVKIIDINEPE